MVNWGEIYYNTMREVSQEAAEAKAREIAGLTIELAGVDERNMDLIRQTAAYKTTRKLSYANAFAAALAKIKNAKLVTGDREFKEVEDEIVIRWLALGEKRG